MFSDRAKIARFALYLFMFSINFEVFNLLGDSGAFSVGRLTGFIYIGAFFYANYRVSFYRLNYLLFALLAFFVVIVVSSSFHLNYLSDRIIDFSLLQNIVLFFILLTHERYEPGVLNKSIYGFALGTITLSVSYLLGIGIQYEGGRLSLFGDNANIIGIRMAISSILLLYSLILSDIKITGNNVLILISTSLMIYLMIESSSRVAFISFIGMLFFMMLLYLSVNPLKRLFPTLILSGLLLYFLVPYILSNDLLINRLFDSKEGDLAGREDIWFYYMPSVWRSIIFGYGFSGFDEVSMGIFGVTASPHNVIIEVFLYGGFVAFAFYLWFNVQVFFISLRMYSIKKEFIGLLLLIPYLGCVLSAQVLQSKIMWFILAFNCIAILEETPKEQHSISSLPLIH